MGKVDRPFVLAITILFCESRSIVDAGSHNTSLIQGNVSLAKNENSIVRMEVCRLRERRDLFYFWGVASHTVDQ